MKKDGNSFSLGQPLPIPMPAALPGLLPLSVLTLLEDGPLNKALQTIVCKKELLTTKLSWGFSPCLPGNCGLLKGKWMLFKRESQSLGLCPTTVFVPWL